jgi:hypothetical protein
MKTNFDQYLKTFFEIELDFIADADAQHKSWGKGGGEKFGECLMITCQSWSVIQENRNKFRLSNSQYNQIQKLFDMIEAFQDTIDYPSTPSEYAVLLNHPEWKKIQRYTQDIKRQIYPELN